MSMNVDASSFLLQAERIIEETDKATAEVMEDILTDLELHATNIAPVDTAALRRSAHHTTRVLPGRVIGEVAMSAKNNGFNYALWTHEESYNVSNPGSYNGYMVGNQYLRRPLYGEFQKYMQWWSDLVAKATK